MAAASWAIEAISSSSSVQPRWTYDAFLSFSGVDTRNNFSSHLLAALEGHGFHTFRDDRKLDKGDEIRSELLKAIEESKISIIIFSKNYAASRWCLDELVKIMECRKTLQQIVLPIFYDVDPSDVRAQKGSLAEAFAKHEEVSNGNKVVKWRSALTEFANLTGWDMQNAANRDEAKVIEEIVDKIKFKLDLRLLSIADHPIGLEDRVTKLKMLLSKESNDVCIVAVWGIGGIGKTTIAKGLYNLINRKFESSSFLANVRETSNQPNGLVVLQRQLLSDIFRNETQDIRNFHHGIEVIKQRAWCRKVLLVLDDVDDLEQLKALAIDQDCFHPGSRIIITTRDKAPLDSLKVDGIYVPEELDGGESLQLFCWYAKVDHAIEEYVELSKQVVHHARGLPLALEVLGSFLSGKSIPEWKSAIAKLKKIPHDDIQGKLQISYDSLSEERKKLFLDIACFFVGMDRNFIIKVLDSRNNYPVIIDIRVLEDRGLIKYEKFKEFNYPIMMHDIIRDMGREIVRKKSEEVGSRSRLWYHEDTLEVLKDGTGTELVEGFFLNLHEPKDVQVNAKAFENMNRLWLLHLNNVHISSGYEHISKRLLWLIWNGFPLKYMSSKLSMENLVGLDLCRSSLKRVWKGTKTLDKLKFLYLSHCYYLTKTPDFSGLKNLEELMLNDCIRLEEVDESIRCLSKLVILDIKNCKKLRKLPSSIWTFKSLERLDFSGCSTLGNLAGFRGSSTELGYPVLSFWTARRKRVDSIGLSLAAVQYSSCLKELKMEDCNLSHLPSEIGSLISLRKLFIRGNNLCTIPDSIGNLTRLEYLNMSDSNVLHLPSEIGSLISLSNLHLSGNNFRSLPDSINNLTRLEFLGLNTCARLQSLPKLPASLLDLQAFGCTLLESISIDWNHKSKLKMDFFGCHKLVENNFANNFIKRLLQDEGLPALPEFFCIALPYRGEFPNYFQYQSTRPCLSFVVPPLVNRKTVGFLCFAHFIFDHGITYMSTWNQFLIRNKTMGIERWHGSVDVIAGINCEDQMGLLSYVPLPYSTYYLEGGDEMEISMKKRDHIFLVKWGINLACEGNNENNNNIIITYGDKH